MKRCENCGWYNDDHRDKCEKCGSPLGEPLNADGQTVHSEPAPGPAPQPKASKYSATIRDTSKVVESMAEETSLSCPKCGYPLAGMPDYCPNCGARLRRSTLKETQTFDAAPPKESAAPKDAPAQRPAAPAFQATIRDIPAGNAAVANNSSDKIHKGTIRDFFNHPFGRKTAQPEEPAQAPAPKRQAKSAAEPENPQVYRLIPVSDSSYPVIYLSEGDIVTIGNRRYKFEK